MSNCSATQQGDEMACGRCGLRWDVADVEAPQCRTQLPPIPGRLVKPPVPPERRHAHEMHQLREAAAGRVDFRGLLAKYMRHVALEEGSTGVAHVSADGVGYFSGVVFSSDEMAALNACAEVAGSG